MLALRGLATVRLMRMPIECFVQGFDRLSNSDVCGVAAFALRMGVRLRRRTYGYSPQDRRIVVILTEFASPWKQAWKSGRSGLRPGLGNIRSDVEN